MPWLACHATPAVPAARPLPVPTPAKSADTAATANHQRALALVNEGDRTVKVDVEAAIAKYTESLQLEPDNVDVLWKLSRAYDKK